MQNNRITARPGKRWTLLLGVGLGGWFVQCTCAGELAYGLGYVGEYSDNIQRTTSNQQSEWINSVLAGVAYRENGPVLTANLLAQAEYRDYKNNIYNDGPLYYADASLLWRISPQRLNWIFVDRYDQITRNITLPDTPDNRVNTNVLSTGPDLFIRLGSVNTLVLGLRYGNATYSEGALDNSRYGASARWLYAANTEMTYSLNYEAEKSEYDNVDLNDNLMRHDVFIRADTRQARARFMLDVGATQIDRDRAGETSGYLARLTWAQQLTSGSSAGILLGSEYQDAGTALLATATSPISAPGAPPSLPVTGDVTNDFFYTKRAELYYSRSGSSLGLNARAYYRDIDYEVARLDRHEAGGRIEMIYSLSSLLATTVYGSHLDIQYQSFTRDDRENETGIRFLYRVNRNLSAALDGRKSWRYSTDVRQEYTDNRVLFSLLYSSSPLFTPVRR